MSRRLLGWFLLAQVLAGGLVFRDALWGRALLAPLDILPAVFVNYRYLDPASSGVPANHRIVDQVIYDLPLQYIIHQSWRRGEAPWWDPFTLGGRPLLADAHINATDPVRVLLYRMLPFEAAYNWTRLAHYFLCGLGMLCLLQRLGFRHGPALWFSLGYEFSGAFATFFGHPWIQGSFVYYPFLWLAWDRACEGRPWAVAVAALLVAAVFCAGNLQSHTYLVVFALGHALGRAETSVRGWLRALLVPGCSGLLGAMLAAPVLGSQIELYSLNAREAGPPFNALGTLAGPGSMATFYPWCLGTFRTLDLSKLIDRPDHLGFTPFIGCAGFVLALVGAAPHELDRPRAAARRAAIMLCLAYVVIISTPLNKFLYMRCAPMAALGLTILAALGFERLVQRRESWRRLGLAVLLLALGAALATNLFAAFGFPPLQPRLERVVAERTAKSRTFVEAPALRAAQVDRLPREISFLNPEAVLGFASLVAVAFFLRKPQWRSSRWIGASLLLLNLIPVLLFSSRFVPCHPAATWHKLLAGGPEQQRLAQQFRHQPLRLVESTTAFQEMVFPASLAALHEVHAVQGYAAVRPLSLGIMPPAELARWRTELAEWSDPGATNQPSDASVPVPLKGLARFRWEGAGSRSFSVHEPGLNRLRLSLQPGAAGRLLWLDTAYPGWQAKVEQQPARLQPYGPCFSALELPASARTTEIYLRYQPAWSAAGRMAASLFAFVVAIIFCVEPALRWRLRHQAAAPVRR